MRKGGFGCNISNNILRDIKDFGIVLIKTQKNTVQGNHLGKMNGGEDYSPIYMKNSEDRIWENIIGEYENKNDKELANKLYRNYDQAVYSLR